jgi:Na+/melibiose symporter-like transporter
MTTKKISRDGYAWGHFGVILFHLLIAGSLIYMAYRFPGEKKAKQYLFFLGLILGIVSILALIPTFNHYNEKDYQYVITMDE